MPESLPEFVDKMGEKITGKVSETAGDLLDAGLTYVGRNILKKYKFYKADDEFQLCAYKQAQEQALKLQEIKNQKIQEYYGDFIEMNIKAIANQALLLAKLVPEKDLLAPDIGFIGCVLEEGKYTTDKELRDAYARLLASSINVNQRENVHPSFVEIIKQLAVKDIHIFEYMRKHLVALIDYEAICKETILQGSNYICVQIEKDWINDCDSSIINLIRLGLLQKTKSDISSNSEMQYAESQLEKYLIEEFKDELESDIDISEIQCSKNFYWLGLTSLGDGFAEACCEDVE